MEFYNYFIIYLLLFRLAIITAGIVSIVLGFKLFSIGVFKNKTEGTSVDAKIGEVNISLKNAAPGTVFALFGAIIIVVMLFQKPPELITNTSHSIDKPAELAIKPSQIDTVFIQNIVSDTTLSTEEIKRLINVELKPLIAANQEMTNSVQMRSTEEEISIINANKKALKLEERRQYAASKKVYAQTVHEIAVPMNGLAWRYYEEGQYALAESIAKVATDLEPQNADFLHTYISILIKNGNENEASIEMNRMLQFNKALENTNGFIELRQQFRDQFQ